MPEVGISVVIIQPDLSDDGPVDRTAAHSVSAHGDLPFTDSDLSGHRARHSAPTTAGDETWKIPGCGQAVAGSAAQTRPRGPGGGGRGSDSIQKCKTSCLFRKGTHQV